MANVPIAERPAVARSSIPRSVDEGLVRRSGQIHGGSIGFLWEAACCCWAPMRHLRCFRADEPRRSSHPFVARRDSVPLPV